MSEKDRHAPEEFAPPDFKPRVYLPQNLLDVPARMPKRKTKLMGRVEYDFDTPIIPLLTFWREELGWKNVQIAQTVRTSRETIDRWVKEFKLGPKARLRKTA